MATITYSLSVKSTANGKSEIIIRFRHAVNGKGTDKQARSGIFVDKDYFKDGKVYLSSKRLLNEENKTLKEELKQAQDKLNELSNYITDSFIQAGAGKQGLPKDWLKDAIEDFHNPKPTDEELREAEQIEQPKKTFTQVFEEYIKSENKDISDGNRAHYWVLWRLLKRYEIVNDITLDFDSITPETISDIQKYTRNEHSLYLKNDKRLLAALEQVSESKVPMERGENTIVKFTKKLRCFIRWANGLDPKFPIEPLTNNNPFTKISIGTEKYGTPYFLTNEERNKLYEAELPERLARQRDIFVFQCLIGCRVSDLWAMTKDNVIDGAIEYIPSKTQGERPEIVRVPLNERAKEILSRYPDGRKLLPFVAQQQYNEDIKEMIKMAGIDRVVTILNPTTRKEEKKHIYEVASSHMARRTFVGNLYSKVQDPNLIGKLSGHAENSRAFARYRDITEEMAKNLVSMLD